MEADERKLLASTRIIMLVRFTEFDAKRLAKKEDTTYL